MTAATETVDDGAPHTADDTGATGAAGTEGAIGAAGTEVQTDAQVDEADLARVTVRVLVTLMVEVKVEDPETQVMTEEVSCS